MTEPSEAVVFLDIDGAFIPRGDRPSRWPDAELLTTMGGGAWVSHEKAARLEALPARLVWLTSWGAEASDLDKVFATRHPEPTPGPRTHDGAGWWKTDLLLGWLREHPEIRRVVWIDDHIQKNLTPKCRKAIREVIDSEGRIKILMVTPERELAEKHFPRIEEFLAP